MEKNPKSAQNAWNEKILQASYSHLSLGSFLGWFPKQLQV